MAAVIEGRPPVIEGQAATPIIEARDLDYRYPDGTKALDGANLRVEEGKITALLGANGAGKSTLFLAFNGSHRPSKGKVLWRGEAIDYGRSGLRELRRRVGMIFQDPDNQLFSASVAQDISFGAVNLGLPEAEVRRRVEQAMERAGIAGLRGKATQDLSFGQKKRVAIAGILVMEPELVVLDEPTAGLDPLGSDRLMRLLTEMRTELGLSFLLATHDVDIVPLYCDRVAVMDAGKIVLEGDPPSVFARKEELRALNLRLPRVGHLVEILREKDGLDVDAGAMTIGAARRTLASALGKTEGRS